MLKSATGAASSLRPRRKRAILRCQAGGGVKALETRFCKVRHFRPRETIGPVTASTMLRRFAGSVLAALLLLLAFQTVSAEVPTSQQLARLVPFGAYLAARHAQAQRDAAAAAAYYRAALKADPDNKELLNHTFISLLASGEVDDAVRLAGKIVQSDRGDRIARLVLGVRDIKQKRYHAAHQQFVQSIRGPITDLAATLLSAWAAYGAGDTHDAVTGIDQLAGPDWYGLFKDLHAGLILDLAGQKSEAGERYKRAYKLDPSEERLAEAYANWAARTGDRDAALKIIEAYQKSVPRHPLIVALKQRIESAPAVPESTPLRLGSRGDGVKRLQAALGEQPDGVFGGSTEDAVKAFQQKNGLRADGVVRQPMFAKLNLFKGQDLPLIVATPQQGAAEVLSGMGAWIAGRGGEDLGLVYLQLALYLEPTHPLALIALGDLYAASKKPQLAIKVYEQVPETSPMRRDAAIQLALNLDSVDRTEEAEKHLEKLIAEQPKDIDAILALGDILRGRKKYAECADVYSKGVATIGKPEKSDWMLFYFRGICFERAKQWKNAEADLKKALELRPDQPQVLNYLGYSWIDKGMNLDEGMQMIRRAVEQRPEDGYIVDSLGWAYYRLGNYAEAVKQLERAVELKPEDPTINDHLGDVYWRVGRQREARFQWSQAKDFKPDAQELKQIEQKLKSGLPKEASSGAEAAKIKKSDSGG
jgi:tetratricopeptide (TPR) repeat protein